MCGWKKVKSKIVHKNSYFKIREDDVVSPNNRIGKYFFLEKLYSVSVIAEDNDGNIYLVGQYRYPAGNKYSWEFVAGGIKKNQTPLQAAKMELEEEAGLKAKTWKSLGYFYVSNGIMNDKCHIFLAKDLRDVGQRLEASEVIVVRKEKIKDIIKMIEENFIVDSFTIITVYKYLLLKK